MQPRRAGLAPLEEAATAALQLTGSRAQLRAAAGAWHGPVFGKVPGGRALK